MVQQEPASSPWEDPRQAEQAIRDRSRIGRDAGIPQNLPQQLENQDEIEIPIKYNSVDEPSQDAGLFPAQGNVVPVETDYCRQPAEARPKDK